jgi:hypothetical protein
MSANGYPDSQRLLKGLKKVFTDSSEVHIEIVTRKPSEYYSTAPTEIIEIRLDKKAIQLFCKYSGKSSLSHGARRGVPYEAKVYKEVIRPLNIPTTKYYGSYKETETGDTWLFIEYLDKNLRLNNASLNTVVTSAEWLGRFHRLNEKRVSDSKLDFLIRYNRQYYTEWVKRTKIYSKGLQDKHPWIQSLISGWKEIEKTLLTPPYTVIHGEFYPHNILFWRDSIRPVDWETTAIAIGEIDLSTLTEKWSNKTIEKCIKTYKASRWLNETPNNFQEKMNSAQLYQQFRWLGEREDWTTSPKIRRRLERTRIIGEKLGLL